MRRGAILAAALFACSAANPARACSPVPDYRVPSNFDLVRKADLVVLARVSAGPSAETLRAEDFHAQPQVAIEPIRVLKGKLPKAPLRLSGYVSERGRAFTQHPTPLDRPHPSSFMGACIRQQYAVGTLVIAVFQHDEQGWRQERSPFARSAEDVEGEHGTWVRAAGIYAEIAALPTPEAQRDALQRGAERLLALHDDPAAPPIAADMLAAAEYIQFDRR